MALDGRTIYCSKACFQMAQEAANYDPDAERKRNQLGVEQRLLGTWCFLALASIRH
jgi:hypothetical protein